jgi:hypothetical protein
MGPRRQKNKKLTPAEIKWTITEKEFLAMSWGIEKFDYYLRGRKFTVITDHSALKAMKTKHIHQDPALRRFTLRRFEVASHTYLTPNLALRRFEVASLLF